MVLMSIYTSEMPGQGVEHKRWRKGTIIADTRTQRSLQTFAEPG